MGLDLGKISASIGLNTAPLKAGVVQSKALLAGLGTSMSTGITGASKKAEAGLAGLSTKLGSLGAIGGKTGGILAGVGSSIGALGVAGIAAGAMVVLAAGLASCVKEASEAQKVMAETNTLLKTTGGVANVTAEGIQKLSQKIRDKTGYDDEAIQSGANMMLTFRKVRNEVGKGNDIFDQSIVAVVDLARKMGFDLPQAAIKVGKALNDPVKGLLNLRRYGIMFTESQEAMIKKLASTGDLLGAQKIVLEEIKGEMGGVADAYGKTLPGQIDIFKSKFGDLMEIMGKAVIPSLTSDIKALVGVFNLLSAVKIPQIFGAIAKLAMSGYFIPVVGWLKAVYDLGVGIVHVFKEMGKQKVEVDTKGAIKDIRDLENVGTLAGRRLGLTDMKVHVDTTAAQKNVQDLDEQIAQLDADLKELTEESTGMGKKLEAELAMTGLAGVTNDVLESMVTSMRDASAGVRDVGYGMMDDLIAYYARSHPAIREQGTDFMNELKDGLEAAADAGPISAQTVKTLIDGLVAKYPALKEVADKLAGVITAGLSGVDISGVLNKIGTVGAAVAALATKLAGVFGVNVPTNVGEAVGEGVGAGGAADDLAKLNSAWNVLNKTAIYGWSQATEIALGRFGQMEKGIT